MDLFYNKIMTLNTPLSSVENILQRKEDHGVLVIMDFSPQFTDLNPIEHSWEHLKRDKTKYAITSQDTQWHSINESWNNLKPEIIHELIEFQKSFSSSQSKRNIHEILIKLMCEHKVALLIMLFLVRHSLFFQ